MGIPVGIDVRDDGDRARGARPRLRLAAQGRRRLQHLPRRQRGQPPERRHARARPQAAPAVRAVLARCSALRARTRGCFDVRARGPARPVGLRQGLGGRGGGADARRRRRAQPLRPRRRRRPRARRAGARAALARRRPAPPPAATAWPRSCAPRDLAVATSGAYERGAHIVDPRTGEPPAGVLSVTVLGPDLGTADAYATAAFAMGADGPAWTARPRRLRGADDPRPTAACSRRPASRPSAGRARPPARPTSARRACAACPRSSRRPCARCGRRA